MNNPIFTEDNYESNLYRGKVICIKADSNSEPILGVIKRSDRAGIYFEATNDWYKHNIFLGDRLNCRIMEQNFEYVLIGTVGNIDNTYPREIQLLIDDLSKYKNKRKHRRYYVNFTSDIFDNQKGHIYSFVRNISLGGVNIVCKEKFEPQASVYVEIPITKERKLSFKARICWSIAHSCFNEYGMEITAIDDLNKDLLDKIIFELELTESKFITNSLK